MFESQCSRHARRDLDVRVPCVWDEQEVAAVESSDFGGADVNSHVLSHVCGNVSQVQLVTLVVVKIRTSEQSVLSRGGGGLSADTGGLIETGRESSLGQGCGVAQVQIVAREVVTLNLDSSCCGSHCFLLGGFVLQI